MSYHCSLSDRNSVKINGTLRLRFMSFVLIELTKFYNQCRCEKAHQRLLN